MSVPLYFVGASGGIFSATLERQADGYFFNPVATAWQAAPTYANKKNTLTEGLTDNRGSYSATVGTGLGNDGIVTVRVHNENSNNAVAGVTEIFISGGYSIPNPVPLATSEDVYYADIKFDKDSATDLYSVEWFKNSSPVLSGITQPSIRVVKRTDGTDLIVSGTLTQIGSMGAYKYDASGAELQSTGAAYVAQVTSIIDGNARIWRKVVGRDI